MIKNSTVSLLLPLVVVHVDVVVIALAIGCSCVFYRCCDWLLLLLLSLSVAMENVVQSPPQVPKENHKVASFFQSIVLIGGLE